MASDLNINLPADQTLSSKGTGVTTSLPNGSVAVGGSASDQPTDEFIFSPDDRVNVGRNNMTTFPWSTNGRMWMVFGGNQFSGSGAMIGRSFVITAGHCVYDYGGAGWASQITFSPGQDGPPLGSSFQRLEYQPFGQATASSLWSFTGWTSNGDWNYDMAWIQLDRNLGDYTGWLGYGYNSDNSFYSTTTFNTAGYPGDASPPMSQYYEYGNPVSYGITSDQLQTNTMDVAHGQSGSGVYYIDGSGNRSVHAVISSEWSSGGTPLYNMFTRMTSGKFSGIQSAINGATAPTDYPDLVDYDAWFNTQYAYASPTTVLPGDSMTVRSVVQNSGTAAAGAFSVRFRLSTDQTYDTNDYLLADASISSLSQLNWADAIATATVPSGIPAGNYWLVWSIDPFGQIAEYDKTNNTGVVTGSQVTVGGSPWARSAAPSGMTWTAMAFGTAGNPVWLIGKSTSTKTAMGSGTGRAVSVDRCQRQLRVYEPDGR